MSRVNQLLETLLEQGAFGAWSGAKQVMEYLGGKEHLIPRYYRQTANSGDNERLRGIVDMVYALERPELLDEPPVLHTETNAVIEQEITVSESSPSVEVLLDLKEGGYWIKVDLDRGDGMFKADIYERAGGSVRFAPWKYEADERMHFGISELEAGICKVSIQAFDSLIRKVWITKD